MTAAGRSWSAGGRHPFASRYDPCTAALSSCANSPNAALAASMSPSLVTNAKVMFLAGNNMSSAYQYELLPLCQIREPPAQSRS